MIPEAKQLYRVAKEAHERIYNLCNDIARGSGNRTPEENLDIAYACREAHKLIHDAQKMINGRKEQTERLFCLQTIPVAMTLPTVETDYCTGKPDAEIQATIPTFKHSPEAYQALMSYLQIDPMLWDWGPVVDQTGKERFTKVVDIHWPGFQYYLECLQQGGFPLPDGIDIDKTWQNYKINIRKKGGKAIDD